MARGVILLTGPIGGVAGTLGERALVALNKSIALAQDLQVNLAAVKEATKMLCARSSFSREPAFCQISPLLPTALVRKRTVFEDITGPYEMRARRQQKLAQVACYGGFLRTEIEFAGDPTLSEAEYEETLTQ